MFEESVYVELLLLVSKHICQPLLAATDASSGHDPSKQDDRTNSPSIALGAGLVPPEKKKSPPPASSHLQRSRFGDVTHDKTRPSTCRRCKSLILPSSTYQRDNSSIVDISHLSRSLNRYLDQGKTSPRVSFMNQGIITSDLESALQSPPPPTMLYCTTCDDTKGDNIQRNSFYYNKNNDRTSMLNASLVSYDGSQRPGGLRDSAGSGHQEEEAASSPQDKDHWAQQRSKRGKQGRRCFCKSGQGANPRSALLYSLVDIAKVRSSWILPRLDPRGYCQG